MPEDQELDVSFLGGEAKTKDGIGDDAPSDDDTGELAETEEDLSTEAQPKKGGVQKRIDTLTRKMRDYERENIYLHGRIEQLEKTGAIKNEETPAQLSRDDFESDEEYLRALNQQNLEILRKEKQAESVKEADKEKEKERKFADEKCNEARQKYPDFDEVALSPNTHNVTQEMLDAAMGENLADILYVLGKNPAASNKIAAMPPKQQIKEIAKIEARIEVAKGQEPKPKTPEDEPAPTLKSSGTSPHTVKDVSQMTMSERMAHWEAEREARLKKEHGLA